MVDIIIVTHGKMCEGLLDSVRMITGSTEHIHAIALNEEESLNDLIAIVQRKIEKCCCQDVLIFVDLFGATPYNAAVLNARHFSDDQREIRVIAGVNLPLIIEAASQGKTKQITELYTELLILGKETITGYLYDGNFDQKGS